MSKQKNRLAVFVASCDGYSDLWEPFFALFRRFWADCPFEVYLMSNHIRAEIAGVKAVLVGDDSSWSDGLMKGLGQIEEEYVLLFLDDLFLRDYVNTKEVLELFEWIQQSEPNCVKMNCYSDNFPLSQKPDKPYNKLVGCISKGTIYRVSTVLTVWRTKVVRDLLKSGESPWEFEIFGTERADKYDGFYSTWKNYFPVINGVIKGRWRRSTIKKLGSLGVDLDFSRRKRMTVKQTIMLHVGVTRSFLLNLFPPRYRRNIKSFVLRAKYNYERQ